MRFKGQVVFITGAGSGMGLEFSMSFAREGAMVAAFDLSEESLMRLAEEIRKKDGMIETVTGDVSRWEDVDRAISTTVARFGRLNVLINNAGITGSQEATFLHSTPIEEWEQVMRVNVRGVYLCSKRAIVEMLSRGGGKIVNVASVAGLVAFPGRAAYTTSKGAVVQMTRSMAVDYAKHNIQVNALCPGMIETPMTQWRLSDPKLREQVISRVPAGRVGYPADLVEPVMFLCGPGSDYMTGQALVVDGGWSAW